MVSTRRLYTIEEPINTSNLAWSPDGRQIAILDGTWLVLINVSDDGHPIEKKPLKWVHLPNAWEWVHFPTALSWSPQGDRLAVSSSDPDRVCTLLPDGTGLRVLADGRRPSWSPNGDEIAFFSGSGLFLMTRYGPPIRFLAEAYLHQKPASWSPSGRFLAFIDASHRVCIVDKTGGSVRQVAEGWICWANSVIWSPTSEEILATHQGADIDRVFLLKTDGTLLDQFDQLAEPSWNFSGTRLLAKERWTSSKTGIFVIQEDGAKRERIGEGKNPVWSPDGTMIVFSSDGDVVLAQL